MLPYQPKNEIKPGGWWWCGGGVKVLFVALSYHIWYRVALGCLICRKIKSNPEGGGSGGVVVVVVWWWWWCGGGGGVVVVVVWWFFYRL
jgi:hypothetical protein